MAIKKDISLKAARFFYGWYNVAGVFVVMSTMSGLVFYNMSVLLEAFSETPYFSTSIVSNAMSIFFLVGGFAGLVVGQLLDRIPPNWMIVIGAVIVAGVFLWAPEVKTSFELYAFYIILAIGHAACGMLPSTTIITRWFNVKRSVALAYGSTGLSFGGIALTPIAAYLMAEGGLASTMPILAAIVAIAVIPISVFILRSDPADMGLRPDGADLPVDAIEPSMDGTSFHDATRSRFFIFMTIAFVFALGAQVGAISHLYNIASSRLNDVAMASMVVSVMASCSLVGRLIGGQILQHYSSRHFTLIIMTGQLLALSSMAFADQFVGFMVTVIFFGLTVGNILMMPPLLVAEAFGLKHYARILSLQQFINVTGFAGGPALMGFLLTRGGSYDIAISGIAIMAVLGLVSFYLSGPVKPGSRVQV